MSIRRTVKLLLDKASARKVERDLKRHNRRVKSEQKRTWSEVGRFVAAAFGIRAIARFTAEMFKLGSAAAETASKFRTVFGGETAANLDDFLDKFGKLAGLTKTEGRDMLAIAGTIGQGVGLAGDDVAAFSQQIVELAADLQSFHDVPIAETFAAIRSGVTGEAEQLKKFGIILRAVDVDFLALKTTGKTYAKELTETEKVTARLALITEKAGVAIGDMARTMDSTANTARQLSQVWRQFQEDIAGGLLPVFSLVINAWARISDGAQGAADVIGGISRRLTEFVGGIQIIAVELNAWFRLFPARIRNHLAKEIELLLAVFVKPAELLVNRIRRLFGQSAIDLTSGLSGVAERLRERAQIDIVAWRALIEEETAAILKAAEIVDEATGGGAGGGPTPDAGPDPATVAAEREADRRAAIRREESAIARQEFEEQERLSVLVQEAHALAKANAEEALSELQAKAVQTGAAMTNALQHFFEATAMGFSEAGGVWSAAGEAAREGGAAIVEGLVAGRVQTEMALGTAALASGLWPPNPAAIAAGFKHFAAAALFRAIPGAIAGGGGGGGGGAGLPRGAIGSSAPGSEQPPGPEIHIYIDPLSPADPDFQRVVLGATQNAKERFGENATVNIHPRTGRG